jgi:hypothetical protein
VLSFQAKDRNRLRSLIHSSGDRHWRILAFLGHEDLCVGLFGFDQFLDVFQLSGLIRNFRRLAGVPSVFALDRSDRRGRGLGADEEHATLSAIIGFAEDLNKLV